MLTQEIRSKFVNYFKKHDHVFVPSSPVIPHEDPTLLFANAGMNQFKDLFLGKGTRDYKRAVTCQKCIRGGGKHNDLENVGHTSRHLTFFEMLGNFSFGDYFKEKAIKHSYEVATEVFGFSEEKIWATIFENDEESYELWKKILPASRIIRMGEKDNFWAMGDTGPCGPCSELYFDRGPSFSKAPSPAEDPSGERYLEFWNLVFMQFNRDSEGRMEPLPKQSIDTGSGLERVVSLKMGVKTLFGTDILRDLIARIEELCHIRYGGEEDPLAPAFHVIADHLRSLAFAIADGAQPGNIDRGYVLRKLLRRAVRYGRMLKFDQPFLAKILPRLISNMKDPYQELVQARLRIEEVLTLEEEAFLRTLKRGGNLLSLVIQEAKNSGGQISGDEAFKLKDTYGLPLEEITLLAKDSHLSVDLTRFARLESEAKERSKAAHKTVEAKHASTLFDGIAPTQFEGYSREVCEAAVIAIFQGCNALSSLEDTEDEALIILDRTPFYGEKGGQVGDSGVLECGSALFEVMSTIYATPTVIAHRGKLVNGSLQIGSNLTASIDVKRRWQIQNNHTATHLLHWALQQVVGEHVRQAGSIVDEAHLRFDFNHHKPLSCEEIGQIEALVNAKIRENKPVCTYIIPFEEAQKNKGIKQFFGDKYGKEVRVVDIEYSKELCGGTHTSSVGTIGYFRITKEGSIAAGVRRIEAVSGEAAERHAIASDNLIHEAAALLKSPTNALLERITKLVDENKNLQQQLKSIQQAHLYDRAENLAKEKKLIGATPALFVTLEGEGSIFKDFTETLASLLGSGILVVANKEKEACSLLVRISDDLVKKGFLAGDLVSQIAPHIGGKGGGKPNSAQAGGKDVDKLPLALEKAQEWIKSRA